MEIPPKPQRPGLVGVHIPEVETTEVDESGPSRERLRDSLHQIRRGAAREEEAGRGSRPIGQRTEHREQLGHPLDLVDHHETLQPFQHQLGIPEPGLVRWPFEIEEGRPRRPAISRARVVLPHWRGPSGTATGFASRAFPRALMAWDYSIIEGISYLVFMELHSRNTSFRTMLKRDSHGDAQTRRRRAMGRTLRVGCRVLRDVASVPLRSSSAGSWSRRG